MEKLFFETPSINRKEDAIEYINEFISYGSKINGTNLGEIQLLPNYASSGSIEGILTDPATGKAVAQGTKIYIYRKR